MFEVTCVVPLARCMRVQTFIRPVKSCQKRLFMERVLLSDALALCSNCSEWKSNLLFYLCIAFGILFLVMLIVNLYLCCAMATPTKIHGDGERKSSNSTSGMADIEV